MARNPNLKVDISADTKGIESGTKKAAQAVKDFEKSTSSTMSALGGAIGIPVDKLKQLQNAVQGAGVKLQQMANVDMKPMIASLAKVAGGISALGIGVAVVAFRELNRLANEYAQTIEGAGAALASQAYIDQYRKSTTAQLDGEGAQKSMNSLKERWNSFWQDIRLSQSFASGANIGEVALGYVLSKKKREDVRSQAEEARGIANELNELQKGIYNSAKKIAEYDVRIAENLNIAKDKVDATLQEREDALKVVEGTINAKYDLKIKQQRELVNLLQRGMNLPGSTMADLQKFTAESANLVRLEQQMALEKRQLLEIQTNLAKLQKEEADAAEKALRIEQHRKDFKASLLPTLVFSDITDPLKGKGLQLPKATIKVEVEPPAEKELIEIGDKIQSIIDSAFSGLGENIAEIITGNMTGGEALLSMLGELAVSAGRLAIGIGTSLLAVKESLKSLNPYVAIGAGVSLVALGTLAKKSVTALGNSMGQGSYSSSTIGNTYSAYSSNELSTREMTVNVTGTLQGDGSQLVAVINNTNKKRQYTT